MLPAAHLAHLKLLIVNCILAESKKSALKMYDFCVYVLSFMELAGHREPLGWMNI